MFGNHRPQANWEKQGIKSAKSGIESKGRMYTIKSHRHSTYAVKDWLAWKKSSTEDMRK